MARGLRPYFAEWDATRGVHVVTYLDEPEHSTESPLAPALLPGKCAVAPVETKPVEARPSKRKISARLGNRARATISSSNEKQRMVERARQLLHEKLANGPQPEAEIEAAAKAAEIPERLLIAAASAFKVRTQRGQWWLPG
jgi:hypothetical protein